MAPPGSEELGVAMDSFCSQQVEEVQLEISTHCNAACPQCTRNINGGALNPHFPLSSLSLEEVKKICPPHFVKQLKRVFFCGGYGEPIAHKQFKTIVSHFIESNPEIYVFAHSNSSLHSRDWWADLARLIPRQRGHISFAIDGLADTHHLHRRKTQFEKVIENARAFINAGGSAKCNFLVFKHNEHQLEEVKKMTLEMGFDEFSVKRSGRFFDQRKFEMMEQWPVYSEDGALLYHLSPADEEHLKNPSLLKAQDITKKYGSFQKYLETTPISCDALRGKKIAINVEGLVLPCNFLMENLYDARFFDPRFDPGSYNWESGTGPDIQFRQLLDRYGRDRINAKQHSIEKILNEPLFSEIQKSWERNSAQQGRLMECALTCGKEFQKCWDQPLSDSKGLTTKAD